jgi:hypothetical protein
MAMTVLAIDLPPDLEERLREAAEGQGVTVVDYVRTVLETTVPVPRRRVTNEELRRAAEAAHEYYSTDPEALEIADFVGDDAGA